MRYLILLISLMFVGCTSIAPSGDEEGVILRKPFFFGHGGVDPHAVNSGRAWFAPTTDGIVFKITPVTYTEEFSDMISKDNTPVTFHAYLKLQIKKGETPALYKNFGEKWYDNSVGPTFRAVVRDKACQYKMFELAGSREILKQIEDYTSETMKIYFEKMTLPLPVTVLQVTIGAVTPPPEVLEETRRTAAQNQSKLTQDARATSETARKQAEINKAFADNAYRNTMGMTMEEYLHLRALEIEKEKIELVREKQNVSIIMGQGIVPMYGVGNK